MPASSHLSTTTISLTSEQITSSFQIGEAAPPPDVGHVGATFSMSSGWSILPISFSLEDEGLLTPTSTVTTPSEIASTPPTSVEGHSPAAPAYFPPEGTAGSEVAETSLTGGAVEVRVETDQQATPPPSTNPGSQKRKRRATPEKNPLRKALNRAGFYAFALPESLEAAIEQTKGKNGRFKKPKLTRVRRLAVGPSTGGQFFVIPPVQPPPFVPSQSGPYTNEVYRHYVETLNTGTPPSSVIPPATRDPLHPYEPSLTTDASHTSQHPGLSFSTIRTTAPQQGWYPAPLDVRQDVAAPLVPSFYVDSRQEAYQPLPSTMEVCHPSGYSHHPTQYQLPSLTLDPVYHPNDFAQPLSSSCGYEADPSTMNFPAYIVGGGYGYPQLQEVQQQLEGPLPRQLYTPQANPNAHQAAYAPNAPQAGYYANQPPSSHNNAGAYDRWTTHWPMQAGQFE